MLSIKEAKRTYYIYKCVASLEDDTKLERLIKIQSYFNVEDLAITLITLFDDAHEISEVNIETSEYECIFNSYDKKLYVDTYTFADLEEDKNINIKIKTNEDKEVIYKCEYIGLDIVEKPITKKLPLIISASGYTSKTYREYEKEMMSEYMGKDLKLAITLPSIIFGEYVREEECNIKEAIKRFKVLYSSYKEDYYFDI